MIDDTERQILTLLRDLENDPTADPTITSTTSTAGVIHIRRAGEVIATSIPTANALESLLAHGWIAQTGNGHFRITSAGLRTIAAS